MKITWNLRMLCAEKGLWTGAALNRRLRETLGLMLTSQSLSNLMTKQPKRISLNIILALCAALECTPNDLLKIDAEVSQKGARRLVEEIVAANQSKAPRRKRIRGKRRVPRAPTTRI